MTIKKDFHTAKDFREFIKENFSDRTYVKEVYNLGNNQYRESPLFLYSGYSVIAAHLEKGVLSLRIYEKDFFIRHIRAGIFREEPESNEIFYFDFTKSKLINSFINDITFSENEDGTIEKIELSFKNEKRLLAECSAEAEGTMCSQILE